MHPASSCYLAQARTTDRRWQAQRDALARVARQARLGQHGHAAPVAPDPGRRVRRRPSPRTVLAIASLGGAVAFVDATIVNIAFPDIARSFPGTSISTLSWVLNAYNVVFAAFLVAAAGIAELLGRRRVFVFGLEAFTAGPLVAVAVAGPTSRLAQRFGPRPVLVVGGLLWGGAVLWFVERVGTTPDFAGRWLPGMVLLGIGAGTLFPNLSGTAVASAPGENFATATGINSVARQVGAALGVAIVVAIIGTPTPATAYAVFRHAWTFGAVCLFAAGLGCLLVGRVKADQAPAPGNAARGDAAQGDTVRAVLAETEPRGLGAQRARGA
jgi:MFS family permease